MKFGDYIKRLRCYDRISVVNYFIKGYFTIKRENIEDFNKYEIVRLSRKGYSFQRRYRKYILIFNGKSFIEGFTYRVNYSFYIDDLFQKLFNKNKRVLDIMSDIVTYNKELYDKFLKEEALREL